jgi:methyl-accepting chemotaxis protein
MKRSIRKKFIYGIFFFLFIIVALLSLSTYHLNKLSDKTEAIFSDNHLSVIYARDMAEGLSGINQEIVNCFLTNSLPDRTNIDKILNVVNKSIQLEKTNITEPGEDILAKTIESEFNKYRNLVGNFIKTPRSGDIVINLQKEYKNLNKQILLLSQLNEKAIEFKTNDAKVAAKNAKLQMEIFGTLCFLITFSFTFSFTSYFNERFTELYNGIKEIVSSNYDHRLYFERKDEFYDISLVFNEMAEKLVQNKQNITPKLNEVSEYDTRFNQVQELKLMLERMKMLEEQAEGLISNLEKKK